MQQNPLGTLGARRFLREFWQHKLLLARGVLPRLGAALDRAHLIELACREDVESRLVFGARKTWRVEHGPFRRRDFARLPPRDWTLLVNGVENFVPAARALQMQFGFVPYARQDDVMVSYAAPGGGVGPHFDSYDVFLLQGAGTRRWQVGGQRDLALVDGAPLKILRRFRPQREWTLQTGDLLYLPPRYAHHGIAVGECITWSIGFRAPSRQEMAARFLDFLQDDLHLDGAYRDPGLMPQRHPATIGKTMLREVRGMVAAIRWNNAKIERCLGEYLTEPRPHIVFGRVRGMPATRFARLVAMHGVQLDLKSRMLLSGNRIFINGESVTVDAATRQPLRDLADRRCLPPQPKINRRTRELLYQWYCAGYIEPGEA
jgi:50S ribosomal protein L16 3-hydroxylase